MSSQSNQPRLSLSKISNQILNDQNADIQTYTAGHLNENHLWKPPEQRTHKPWDSSSGGTVTSLTKRSTVNKKSLSNPPKGSTKVKDMYDTLATFTIGNLTTASPETLERHARLKRHYTSRADDFKLPNLFEPDESNEAANKPESMSSRENYDNRNQWSTRSLNDKKLSSLSHRSANAPSYLERLPVTDKELALHYLKCPFIGSTKQEKFKNFSEFERNVIGKNDLAISNVLHTTDLAQQLEKKLQEELARINVPPSSDSNLVRLEAYSNVFDQLIKESESYGSVLGRIKNEYDEYLFWLIRNQNPNAHTIQSKYEKMQERRDSNDKKTRDLEAEIKGMEELFERTKVENAEMKIQIESERKFNEDKTAEENFAKSRANPLISAIERTSAQQRLDDSKSQMIRSSGKITIGERIEATTNKVLFKLNEFNAINNKLKQNNVPSIVVSNLSQTLKDIEMETHKINEQIRFLEMELEESENGLRTLLLEKDKTEFATENAKYLIKCINKLEVLNFENKIDKSGDLDQAMNSIIQQLIISNTEEIRKLEDMGSPINRYDDYFS